MRMLIVGCGSIGKRHLNNILSFENPHNVAIFDTVEGDPRVFCCDDLDYLIEFFDPTHAIICLPTSLHIDFSHKLAVGGVNIMIEKPLSHSLDGIEELIDGARGVYSMVGMTYRFHPIIQKLRDMISDGLFGRVYSVQYTIGQNLLTWPSGNDYENSYVAKKDMGGGVTLTTLSHLIDNVSYLFGKISKFEAFVDKVSNFRIDTDDICVGIAKTENDILVNWQADLMRTPRKNEIHIMAENGTFTGNFCDASYSMCVDGESATGKFDFVFNDMYVMEVKYFLDCVKHQVQPTPSIQEGAEQLKLLLDILNRRTK